MNLNSFLVGKKHSQVWWQFVGKVGSNLGPFTAEYRVKPWSETQNQAKRINNIGYWLLLRDQGVEEPTTILKMLRLEVSAYPAM
jgi:hypothetical protein